MTKDQKFWEIIENKNLTKEQQINSLQNAGFDLEDILDKLLNQQAFGNFYV